MFRYLSSLAIIVAFSSAYAAEDSLYFPPIGNDWARVDPASLDWDVAALEHALNFARERKSSAVIVLHSGRIAAEKYWEPTGVSARYRRMVSTPAADGHVREDVASVQKSVVSFLSGIAEGKKQIDLDAPVNKYLGAGWSQAGADAEQRILVRHLLSMSSGLDTSLGDVAPAGEKWAYNTNAYALLVKVLEAATGKSIHDITREWLSNPTGMRDSRWEERRFLAGGEDANAIGYTTSARDLARFGLLVLAGGTWDGRDLLGNPGYVRRATTSSQMMNPAYGLLWWLNGQSSFLRPARAMTVKGSLIRTAPNDLVMAAGALGRKVYVVPSKQLVIVRLGDDPGEDFDTEFWRALGKVTP